MRVIVAGGSGFLGRYLTSRLVGDGHGVTILTRHDAGISVRPAGPRIVRWDPENPDGEWAREIDGAEAVVNLAGAGIADRRWSADRKALLRSSRVDSTRSLVSAIRAAARKPPVLIQGSAVGFYGSDEGDRELDESFPPGADALGDLSVAWEAEAHPASALGCRVVFIRTGIALARDGGALQKLLVPFRMFAGGPLATGRQYISWIHIDDWVNLVSWAAANAGVSGAVNATAPTPVTNAEFSRALAHALHRPSWLRVPAFALRGAVGEMADVALIRGQRVVPKRALALGFRFDHPVIGPALADLLDRNRPTRQVP